MQSDWLKTRWILVLAAACFFTWLIGLSILRSLQGSEDGKRTIFQENVQQLNNSEKRLSAQLDSEEKENKSASDILRSCQALALVQWQLRRFDAARATDVKALSIAESAFGKNSKETATCLSSLANVERDAGDYQKSIKSFEKVLEIDQQLSPDDKILLARDLNNLGAISYSLSLATADTTEHKTHLLEAKKYFEQALTIYRQENNGSAQLAEAIENQSLVLRDLGDSEQAKILKSEGDAIWQTLRNAKSRF